MSSRPRCLHVLIALMVPLAIPGLLGAATITVDRSGHGTYTTIQAAVDRASAGDVIVINPGTYAGTGNCDVTVGNKAITIQGTAPDDANVVASTIVDCQGSTKNAHRGFYFSSCMGAKIAGLTITNGWAAAGGAIFCTGSVLQVSNCQILNNGTLPGDGKTTLNGGCGGGIYAETSSLDVINSVISGNLASDGTASSSSAGGAGGDGGGIYATGSAVHVDGSTVSNNHTGSGGASSTTGGRGGDGGGLCCDSLSLANSQIINNGTGSGSTGTQGGRGGNGGAVACGRSAITNTFLQGNTAGSGGNATSSKGSAGAGGIGGGVFCSGSLQMSSSLVAGNRSGRGGSVSGSTSLGADGAGAGVYCPAGQIDHCTVVSNVVIQSTSKTSVSLGGGISCTNQTAISNSIVWSNSPDQLAGQDCSKVLFCDITGGTCPSSQGNLSVDPNFVQIGQWVNAGTPSIVVAATDPTASWSSGNYRLSSQSPCIDAGDPGFAADPNAVDLAGKPRVADGAVDIGAYEFQSLVAVYRFDMIATGQPFYTASESERDKLLTQLSSVWSFKGVAYYTYVRAVEPRLMPVYRFWSDTLSSHFWTISESEKNKLITGYSAVWQYEGVVFYAYVEGQRPSDTMPVYRFWSAKIGAHLYTIDAAEKDRLIADTSHLWTYEMVAWYAYATPPAEQQKSTTAATTYDFTAGSDAAIYQMSIKAAIDGVDASIDQPTMLFIPALGQMAMDVDLDALTIGFKSLFLESGLLQHDAAATPSGTGSTGAVPFTLSVYGFFNTSVSRGPYAIDPNRFTFPPSQMTAQATSGETFAVVGSVNLDQKKYDVNLTLDATDFALQGIAALDQSGYPDSLGLTMSGPFQWRRQGHTDLLLDTTVKGHRVQVYVTSLSVQTTGAWSGKSAGGGGTAKSTK